MITTSDDYKTLLADPHHYTESRIIISGPLRDAETVATIGDEGIVSMSTSLDLFGGNGPSVGNCSAAELNLVILTPSVTIPKMAKIKIQIRLSNRSQDESITSENTSEWIDQGVFFVGSRAKDKKAGTTTIHGYDALMLLGQTALDQSYEWGSIADITYINTWVVTALYPYGISVDTSLITQSNYNIKNPGYGYDGALTMRQVMKYIAAYYAGNWYADYSGTIRLKVFGGIPDETWLLCDEWGCPIEFTDGNCLLLGGDDDG